MTVCHKDHLFVDNNLCSGIPELFSRGLAEGVCCLGFDKLYQRRCRVRSIPSAWSAGCSGLLKSGSRINMIFYYQ